MSSVLGVDTEERAGEELGVLASGPAAAFNSSMAAVAAVANEDASASDARLSPYTLRVSRHWWNFGVAT